MPQDNASLGQLDSGTMRAIAERAAAYALRDPERAREKQRRRQELRERIVAYLAENPKASANEVFAAVGGNRNFVPTREGPVLAPEYHPPAEGIGS